jgi:hypothetical protein
VRATLGEPPEGGARLRARHDLDVLHAERISRVHQLKGLVVRDGALHALVKQPVEDLHLEALHASSARNRLKKVARLEARN